jgi:lysozyme family protein
MKSNFDAALLKLLSHEGGFVNNIRDSGGMTNRGVTRRTLENWLGRAVTETEMRNLTPEAVGPLYKKMYWDKVQADALPSGVDYAVFDCAVNSGPVQALKFLQRAVGVADDGVMGPLTLRAVNALRAGDVVEKFTDARLNFLKSLHNFDEFGRGWCRRVEEVEQTAVLMCGPDFPEVA